MKIFKFLTLIVVLFLMGCGRIEIGIERAAGSNPTVIVQPTYQPIATAPVEKPSPTAINLPPADTETVVLPTATLPLPTDTPHPQKVKIYLIGVGDNGQSGPLIGCGDSAIPVEVETPPTQGVLKASMEALLSMKEQYYGESGLYNALYQSDLQVESASIKDGKAAIYLSGTLLLGGECDIPRVEAQLEQTALQFSTVQEVSIFINGKPLKEVLSLRG